MVFDVQRYSLHDGPGLRTNVFLKGCPLHCPWCANPESRRPEPDLALFARDCIVCGQFEEACPVGWPKHNGARLDEETRVRYAPRTAMCPTAAIRWIGQRRTAGEVMQEVLRDQPFYQDGGGMTLTGGEPTMQPHLAEALLRLGRAEGIDTAMETCGHTAWPVLERLLPLLDLILYDLKHMDSDTHRAVTGLGNELILANLQRLAGSGAALRIRVPLIPGFNATKQDISAIARFVRALRATPPAVDLLPYHTLGRSKYQALGRGYPWAQHARLSGQEVEVLAGVMRAHGLGVQVGG